MTVKSLKFFFYNNPVTSSLSLRDAQPIQSRRALAGMNTIFNRLREVNQEAYDRTRHLDAFTVTLTPIAGSKNHRLQISSKKLEINAKLKPETSAYFLPLRAALKSPGSNPTPSVRDTLSSMNSSSFLKDTLLLWSMAVSTFRQWMRSLGKLIFGDSAKEPKQGISFSPPTLDGSYAVPEKAIQLMTPSKSVTVAAQPDVFYDLDDQATHRKSDTSIFDIAQRKKEDRFLRKQKEKLERQHKREKGKTPPQIKSHVKKESEPAEIKADDRKQAKTPDTVYRLLPRKDLPTPLEIPPELSPVQLEAKDLQPHKAIEKEALTTFVFKREGERFQMTEARLSDGTPYKSPKVESVMQSILVQSSEYQKISKYSELRVTLSSSSPSVVRIQSQDNGGLDITIKQLKSRDGQFLVGNALNSLDEKQPSNKPETLESFAAKIFSWVKKPELARKFFQELKEIPLAKEENVQHLLQCLLSRVDQLINSEDPIVERALDHMLAQKDSLMSCSSSSSLLEKAAHLIGEINMVLRHIEVSNLDRQIEAQEASLSNHRPPYLTATFKFNLKDANEFLIVETTKLLEGRLQQNRVNLKKHEETLASQLKELQEMEDLLVVRTPEEQKAKLEGFIAQNAGKPFFEEMLKASKMMQEILGLLKDHENAYFFQKPIIWAKILSYGPSIMKTFEELPKKLPETILRPFLFLLVDITFTNIKKIFGESIMSKLPELRTSLSEGVAFTRERAEMTQKEVEKCQQSERQIGILIKITEDRTTLHRLYQESPEAKTEIEQLENTEYQLLGATLRENKKWRPVSEKNRIVQMMAEMGAKEHEEALNKLEDTRYRYKQEHGILQRR